MKKIISRKTSQDQKISAMIQKVAAGYIDMGETTEERENYLRSACTAWNISCLPSMRRDAAINQYLVHFQQINGTDPDGLKALEEDLKLLIKQKDKLYPSVKVQILDSKIENFNGQNFIVVISTKITQR